MYKSGFTYEDLERAGRSLLRGPRDWQDRVIQRAFDEQCGIYHAHWLDAMDRLDEMPKCTICDGRLPGSPNPHWLCVYRAKRGQPTPKMDYTPSCGCTPCRKTSGEAI